MDSLLVSGHIERFTGETGGVIELVCRCDIDRDHDYVAWVAFVAGPLQRARVVANLEERAAVMGVRR